MQDTKLQEEWKPINGFPGYEISNYGNARTIDRMTGGKNNHFRKGQKLKCGICSTGYPEIMTWKVNKGIKQRIHRLVALHFIPNPEAKKMVNHKDGVKTNNHIENLEWATRRENEDHAMENGLKPRGEENGWSKLTEDGVREIFRLYSKGMNYVEIEKEMGIVTKATIGRVIQRKIWAHVTDIIEPEVLDMRVVGILKNGFERVYDSAADAARKTGADSSKISMCLNGHRKIHNSTKWVYLRDHVPTNPKS
jgi:hypothetical protein